MWARHWLCALPGSCKTAQHHGGVMAYGVLSGKTFYFIWTAIGLLPIPATVVADLWLPQRVDVAAR